MLDKQPYGRYDDGMAGLTKRDLTEALKGVATKDDLKSFATKDDLKPLAHKADLEPLATKRDVEVVELKMERSERNITEAVNAAFSQVTPRR